MDMQRRLASAIIAHLKLEIGSRRLSEDANESLEVAVQCLEQAYNLDKHDVLSDDTGLLQIYGSYVAGGTGPKFSPVAHDKELAEALKNEGNAHMKNEQFQLAVDSYSKAIDNDPANAVFYCNRAAAYTSLGNYKQAIKDCDESIKLDRHYGKAYARKGLACINEKDFQKAKECYEEALRLEPSNSTYRANLELAKERLEQQGSKGAAAGAGFPNLAGMDLSSLLSNPAVMNMAQSFMQNPQMQNMFANMMGNMMQTPESSSAPGSNTTRAPPAEPARESNVGGAGAQIPGFPPGFNLPQGLDFSQLLGATQNFAAQMQEENPELVEQLRQQFQQGSRNPPDESAKK